MYSSSSEFPAVIDISFEHGYTLALSVLFNAEEELAAESVVMDTDGFIHVKVVSSYAPINLGDRVSDIGWYDQNGNVLGCTLKANGVVYAPEAYNYAIETPAEQLPLHGIVL